MKNLLNALKETQDQVIGLMFVGNSKKLIMKVEDHTTKVISVGTLLGLEESSVTNGVFKTIMFPDNKTLAEMMKEPLEFGRWWEENVPVI